MRLTSGRVAVVTGAGSGIGEGLARACHEKGMRVVVSDIDLPNAQRVAAAVDGVAVRTDVRDPASVQELADVAFDRFGSVHLLCNNAGVAPVGALDTLGAGDWAWGLGVNLDGIVHGLDAFLPGMFAQADPGHVVNTASMAGVTAIASHAIYCASKHATVALTESVRRDGAAFGVSASVLCPGMVRTGILESDRNKPADLETSVQNMGIRNPLLRRFFSWLVMRGSLEPLDVGRTTLQAVENDDLYVFTHKHKAYRDPALQRLVDVEHALAPAVDG